MRVCIQIIVVRMNVMFLLVPHGIWGTKRFFFQYANQMFLLLMRFLIIYHLSIYYKRDNTTY